MLACHSYISGAGVRDGFYRKSIYHSFGFVVSGDSGRCSWHQPESGCEISPCVVVTFRLLPRDFGGSHGLVPAAGKDMYILLQGTISRFVGGKRAGDRFALYIAFGQLSGEYYQYGNSADYISHIHINTAGRGRTAPLACTVSMNRILSEQGFVSISRLSTKTVRQLADEPRPWYRNYLCGIHPVGHLLIGCFSAAKFVG